MTPPIVLREYEPSDPIRLTAEELSRLQAAAGRALAIAPAGEPHHWILQPGALVGTIVVPGVRVLIRPKVSNATLFHLLEPSTEGLAFGETSFDYDTREELTPAFAAFFVRHLERALARGLVRSYREEEAALMGVRGRVAIDRLSRRGGLPVPVDCTFDEHTADNPLNRVIAGAARRVVRWPSVSPSTRRGLRRALSRLEEVGQPTRADIHRSTVFTRLNRHHRAVERLARLVLAGRSLNDSEGSAAAGTFLIDMNTVFEQFVEDRLRRYLGERLEVLGQHPDTLDVDGQIHLRPDLVFRRTSRLLYVADCKYKLVATGKGRESDYYQLLAYCTALGLPEGMLIYCQHDGSIPPLVALAKGMEQKRLATAAIRLDGAPNVIDARLRELADLIYERIPASSESFASSV